MPHIYGQSYAPTDLRRRVGRMEQIAGIRAIELDDGPERGVRGLEVKTGSGLRFTIVVDRGFDIADAELNGAPLAWHSTTGVAHPHSYDDENLGWLRGFHGGLLTTCGFSNVAVASEDRGEYYGIHGRASYLPASAPKWRAYWEGDDYVLWAEAELRETRVFGENFRLIRRYTTRLGSNSVTIEDRITNEAYETMPFMMLYHVNGGFPVLDDDSELLIDSVATPRDAEAEKGREVYQQGGPPTPGFKEQVFHHDVKPDEHGICSAALVNRSFNNGQGLGLRVRYRKAELPQFWQWRQVGEGVYVWGLEPANCHVLGRGRERQLGRLPRLEPGQTVEHWLEITALTGAEIW